MESERRSKAKSQDMSPETRETWPKVAIIVLNWNGWRDTIECLESLQRITYPNYQIIVVDNGSTDDSMAKIKAWAEGKQEALTPEPTHPLYHLSHPPVKKPIPYIEYDRKEAEAGGNNEKENKLMRKRTNGRVFYQSINSFTHSLIHPPTNYPLILIQTGENLGFAGGNNVGIRYALYKNSMDYFLLLNNDVVVDKRFLEPLVQVAESNKKVGAVGPKIYSYERSPEIYCAGCNIEMSFLKGLTISERGRGEIDRGQFDEIEEIGYIAGCCLKIKREAIKAIGLMDERYFLYFEDTDWILRMRQLGWTALYVPYSIVWHKGSRTVGQNNPWRVYYMIRNKLLLFQKIFRKRFWCYLYPLFLGKSFILILQWLLTEKKDNNRSIKIQALLNGQLDFIRRKFGAYKQMNQKNLGLSNMNKRPIKKKIAIIHPTFSLGGAGAVAAWTLEAVKDDYDLTFITTEDINFPELNVFFGTDLKPTEVKTVRVRLRLGHRVDGFLVKIAMAERYYKAHRKEFDLAIATRCEMDLGEPGIQYIHCPIWNDQMLRRVGQLPSGWQYREGFLRWIYRQSAVRLGRYSEDRMKQNITLVNSNWMGERVRETYGIESRTVYPPVNDDFPDVRWEEREDGFVCLGAVAPGKHVEEMIQVIKAVRAHHLDVHLHIIGGCSSPAYAKKIEHLCKENREWLFWEGRLPRKDLAQLVAMHKYGIHGMPNEHFGIAVAEMVKAGCIPFVPNSGGQVEIVGDGRLLYADPSEAVDKILYVLQHEGVQAELREHLRVQGQQFSAIAFMRAIKKVVKQAFGAEDNVAD